MTLNDIIVSALAQLDRGSDAQTLDVWRDKFTRFANDGLYDLASALGLSRTEELPVLDGSIALSGLARPWVKLLWVTVDGRAVEPAAGDATGLIRVPDGETARICYRCKPRMLSSPTDEPELPAYAHPLIVTYVVARERAAGDPAAQRGSSLYFQLYEAQKAALRPHFGEPGAYQFKNRW